MLPIRWAAELCRNVAVSAVTGRQSAGLEDQRSVKPLPLHLVEVRPLFKPLGVFDLLGTHDPAGMQRGLKVAVTFHQPQQVLTVGTTRQVLDSAGKFAPLRIVALAQVVGIARELQRGQIGLRVEVDASLPGPLVGALRTKIDETIDQDQQDGHPRRIEPVRLAVEREDEEHREDYATAVRHSAAGLRGVSKRLRCFRQPARQSFRAAVRPFQRRLEFTPFPAHSAQAGIQSRGCSTTGRTVAPRFRGDDGCRLSVFQSLEIALPWPPWR
jgi:hypothetical protein